MAAPRQLEPHTRAKHEILKRYLQAWMVILSQGRFPEILYIDGFAGPGQYEGGEAGSTTSAKYSAKRPKMASLRIRGHFQNQFF
jgi:three-Cys-motif partner protein